MKFRKLYLWYISVVIAGVVTGVAAASCGDDVESVTVKEDITSHRMSDGTTCYVLKYNGSATMDCK